MKLAFLLLIAIVCISGHQLGVRLEDLKELTFRKDVWTKNVRMPSSPQLLYVGGNARRNISQVKLVKCVNTGDDWNCTANLDPVLNFTKVSINCEGASYPDDENILADSCYLEYTLNYMPDVRLENVTSPVNNTNGTTNLDFCQLTNRSKLINMTNDTPVPNNDTCSYNMTYWPFDQLSDDPDTQQLLLLASAFGFAVTLLLWNCDCRSTYPDKRYVVDNAEDASSESENSEELKM